MIARDGTTTEMREYSDRVVLVLLRMRRETVAIANEGIDQGEFEEARDRIVAPLLRIREREEGVETKCVVDRAELVAWRLRQSLPRPLPRAEGSER